MNKMLRLENIYKSYSHHGTLIEVLMGIDIEINPGDSLAITGASGVGKSTLLNIVGSLDPPTEGHVRFGDRYVYEMNDLDLSRFIRGAFLGRHVLAPCYDVRGLGRHSLCGIGVFHHSPVRTHTDARSQHQSEIHQNQSYRNNNGYPGSEAVRRGKEECRHFVLGTNQTQGGKRNGRR